VSRRQVRVSQSFFERLDALLPQQRDTAGVPSATDLLLHELPTIIDRLARDYEGSTLPVAGDPEIRVLVTAGVLVEYLAIYAVVADDDAVEIIYLDLS
jgi:hypothetical protein